MAERDSRPEAILDWCTALRLHEAGRSEEGRALAAGGPPALRALLTRPASERPAIEGPLADALAGWDAYFEARYADAAAAFARAVQAETPWIVVHAATGLGKVATDTGRLATAARWCALAAALARHHELHDLLAAAIGARAEALLRGGEPRGALDGWSLDLALLPCGSPFRGRVLCYRAHALSRLGREAWPAAELAYRLAMHTPGERTAPFARGGLALLGARWAEQAPERGSLITEAKAGIGPLGSQAPGPGRAWCFVAAARLEARRGRDPRADLEEARSSLPSEYHFEQDWLVRWGAALGVTLAAPAGWDRRHRAPALPAATAHRDWGAVTRFDHDETGAAGLWDEGLDSRLERAVDVESLWAVRQAFMP